MWLYTALHCCVHMCSLNNWKRIRPFIISLRAALCAEGSSSNVTYRNGHDGERGEYDGEVEHPEKSFMQFVIIYFSLFFVPIYNFVVFLSFY